jgi:hypothetical protein
MTMSYLDAAAVPYATVMDMMSSGDRIAIAQHVLRLGVRIAAPPTCA